MVLLESGVPYRLAFGEERPLSKGRRLAMVIWAGQQKGAVWSWSRMGWEKPKA